MKTYLVKYEQTFVHEFYIEAENEDAAKKEFKRKKKNKELVFDYEGISEGQIYEIEEW